ncbi:MAG TPA: N-acyl homoserine lactonase family protein [Rhizomicrobium sp.]|nr:N-acyl homoserine lactonase family protein [Rhizomicrobium sp.]
MKMHVLDLGRLHLDSNIIVGGAVSATRSAPAQTTQWIEIPVSGYCIDHPDGRILFDLGCHPKAMGPGGRWQEHLQEICPYSGGEECDLPNRLEQLGLGPNDIRYAVISHLHNDHAGCVEFFRKTQLIVHEDEFSAAFRAYGLRQKESPYVLKDMAEWAKQDLTWRLVERDEGDIELAEGVEILNLGVGHAWGMLALHLRLKELGSVILASDAIYSRANYEPATRLPGFYIDGKGYKRAVDRIRQIATRHHGQVWFGHDAEQFAAVRKSTEGYYE